MFQIRREHVDALSERVYRDFEDRLVEHLTRTNPERVAKMEESEVRAAIKAGVEKAATYQIFLQTNVAGFVQLQFEEGNDFDVDSAHPWAKPVLTDPELDESQKIGYLRDYVEAQRSGPGEEDEARAIAPAEEEPEDEVAEDAQETYAEADDGNAGPDG